jgi:RNA polymerase sigma-70 factor (ECF subfamily)
LALWQSLDRFDGRCSLRTWAYRVAHNVAISKVIRRRTRKPKLVGVDELDLRTESGDREEQFDRARAAARLLAIIHELKPLDRQVMLLYLEDLDALEIAEVTGLSAVNVATKVHRIKTVLAARFLEGASHVR